MQDKLLNNLKTSNLSQISSEQPSSIPSQVQFSQIQPQAIKQKPIIESNTQISFANNINTNNSQEKLIFMNHNFQISKHFSKLDKDQQINNQDLYPRHQIQNTIKNPDSLSKGEVNKVNEVLSFPQLKFINQSSDRSPESFDADQKYQNNQGTQQSKCLKKNVFDSSLSDNNNNNEKLIFNDNNNPVSKPFVYQQKQVKNVPITQLQQFSEQQQQQQKQQYSQYQPSQLQNQGNEPQQIKFQTVCPPQRRTIQLDLCNNQAPHQQNKDQNIQMNLEKQAINNSPQQCQQKANNDIHNNPYNSYAVKPQVREEQVRYINEQQIKMILDKMQEKDLKIQQLEQENQQLRIERINQDQIIQNLESQLSQNLSQQQQDIQQLPSFKDLEEDNEHLEQEQEEEEKQNDEGLTQEEKDLMFAMKLQAQEHLMNNIKQSPSDHNDNNIFSSNSQLAQEYSQQGMALLHQQHQGGGVEDLDSMSYEQLIELQEKIGFVSKGLKKEQIKMIKKKIYQASSLISMQKSELCSICFSEYQQDEKLRVLQCDHDFHSKCIKSWLQQDKKCPICKFEVNFEEKQQSVTQKFEFQQQRFI